MPAGNRAEKRRKKPKDVFALIESRMTPASIARSDAKARKLLCHHRPADFVSTCEPSNRAGKTPRRAP